MTNPTLPPAGAANEPVAWAVMDTYGSPVLYPNEGTARWYADGKEVIPLYRVPPSSQVEQAPVGGVDAALKLATATADNYEPSGVILKAPVGDKARTEIIGMIRRAQVHPLSQEAAGTIITAHERDGQTIADLTAACGVWKTTVDRHRAIIANLTRERDEWERRHSRLQAEHTLACGMLVSIRSQVEAETTGKVIKWLRVLPAMGSHIGYAPHFLIKMLEEGDHLKATQVPPTGTNGETT